MNARANPNSKLESATPAGGAQGLVHGSVGRRSSRSKPAELRDRALELIRQKE